MPTDPFRRPPMVDIPWGERERWWDRTTRRLAEAKLWSRAESLADLGELVAQFAEGKLLATPDHGGERDPETVQIAAPLAHANRQGFVTGCSQPGEDGPVWEQRAAVQGWASPETVEKLRRLVAGTRLQIQVAAERPRRTDYSNAVNVSRTVTPDGVHEHTGFGAVPGRRTSFVDLGRSDLTEGAAHVTIYDPEWGDHSLLWDRLGQADWDDPPPTEPEKTMDDQESAWRELCQAEYKLQIRHGGNDGHPANDLDTSGPNARAQGLAEELAHEMGIPAGALRRRAGQAAYDYGQDPGTDYDPDRFASPDWDDLRDEAAEVHMGPDAAGSMPPPPPAEPYDPSRSTEEADRADLRDSLREMDDEDLDLEKRITGELQEMAEDAGDTERAARIGRDYADFEAEQQRRDEAARTQPPEPPIGTVLETRDGIEDYRIERTDDGWHLQYRDGEDEHGRRLHPGFGGRGIGWSAAWSAWGPPNGAAPFRQVPADSPLLPAHPAEPGDDDPIGPDASDGRFGDGSHGMPPPAPPYAPARAGTTPSRLEIKRTGRWYDENPITSTNTTSTGGTGMSIGDAKQGMLGPIEKLNEALGAIQSGRAALEEAQAGLLQAAEGSNQAEADQAHAQVAESLNKVDDAQQQIAQAQQEFEGVAQRL